MENTSTLEPAFTTDQNKNQEPTPNIIPQTIEEPQTNTISNAQGEEQQTNPAPVETPVETPVEASRPTQPTRTPKEDKKEDKIIFALDIGTRCVVGMVGYFKDDKFNVVDFEKQFHKQRTMKDGQIENIEQVAKVVQNIKAALETRLGAPLKKVSIAAAGRSLKTIRTTYEQTIQPNEEIGIKQLHSLEYAAIGTALEAFENESQKNSFYCVGYSVTNYLLDDYSFSSLIGHKGTYVKIDLIAAFLPHNVIESLYSVTRMCNLEVENLTLEPIAAINVIVPTDIRLLNIALVDIGAGTSDIAISKNGGIVAYDMATIAGDEITEAIMNTYITDFETAEDIKVKLSPQAQVIEFQDILGNQYRLTPEEVYNVIKPAIETLGNCIAERILGVNTTAPVAVFLVGGGSQIYGLAKIIAHKLSMPEARVAVGGRQPHKHINLCSEELLSPEYITPIGIGAVASMYDGCDFFSITVNDYKVMLLNHSNTKVLDALLLAGLKPSSLIGISPRPIAYTLNGIKQTLRGAASTPGEIYVNDQLASIDTPIKQGDIIRTVLPKHGVPAKMTMGQILNNYPPLALTINHDPIDIQPFFTVNGQSKELTYCISPMDEIEILTFSTVGGIAEFLGLDPAEISFLVNDVPAPTDQKIHSGDGLLTLKNEEAKTQEALDQAAIDQSTPEETALVQEQIHHFDKTLYEKLKPTMDFASPNPSPAPKAEAETTETQLANEAEIFTDWVAEPTQDFGIDDTDFTEYIPHDPNQIRVAINDSWTAIPLTDKKFIYFVDTLNYVEIDTKNPQGDLIIQLNGKDAAFMDIVNDGDKVEIRWSK